MEKHDFHLNDDGEIPAELADLTKHKRKRRSRTSSTVRSTLKGLFWICVLFFGALGIVTAIILARSTTAPFIADCASFRDINVVGNKIYFSRIIQVDPANHVVISQYYSIDSDGTQLTHLFDNTDKSVEVFTVSPDGQQIAYDHYENLSSQTLDDTLHIYETLNNRLHIYIVDGLDNATRRLLTPGFSPHWSPDGKHIAFIGEFESRHVNLYVIDADGSNMRLLSSGKDFDIFNGISWSPDGQTILSIVDQTVKAINLDGSDQQKVTFKGLASHPSQVPEWSPTNGNKFAFMNNGQIYLYQADSQEEDQLTFSANMMASRFQWLMDGHSIAFVAIPPYSRQTIFTMNTDGAGQPMKPLIDTCDSRFS